LNPPPGREFRPQDIALSPDGKHLAFVTGGSVSKLWVRALDSLTARELRDTDGAGLPFWSPDQNALGFFAGGKVKRIDLENERIVTLADAPAGRGGSWNADNVILFSAATNGPIWRVPAAGGTPVAATTLNAEASHRFPVFLPDGRHFLFYVRAAEPKVRGIYWASLDNPEVRERVVETMFTGVYAPPGAGQSGQLLWMTEEGGLIAQAFDAARGRVSGDPALVPNVGLLQQLGYDRHTALSISNDGTMVYGMSNVRYQLVWHDRQGKPLGTIGEPDAYIGDNPRGDGAGLRISPDGKRAAVAAARAGDRPNLWTLDLASGDSTRVTTDGGNSGGVAWSPNGLQVAYITGGAFTDMRSTVFVADTGGAAPRIRLTNTPHSQITPDWSPDGKFVLFQQTSREANFDLWYVSMSGDRKAVPYLQTTHQESRGRFSPDGEWVAYTSNQSGRQEIWVAAFPTPTTNQQVSFSGGENPVWRRDGKELYYRSAEGNLMAMSMDVGGKLRFGTANILFPMMATEYDVAPEGDRFLMLTRVRAPDVSPLIVLLNWQQKLKP
jgi:Tol biopolymer transport system component